MYHPAQHLTGGATSQYSRLVSVIWTTSLAYAVGLIATDGCLSKDGRHIEFTSKDLDLVETFKRCLNLKNRISWKTGGYTKKRYPHIQFGSVEIYRGLLEIGLCPKKSKCLAALLIPDEYFFDFLRGCLDGDGCIRTYPDPAYPNAIRLYVTFFSASQPYLEWLRFKVANLVNYPGFIVQRTRVWELTYAKRASQSLLKAIYYRKGLPCLQRKYRIAEPFLQKSSCGSGGTGIRTGLRSPRGNP